MNKTLITILGPTATGKTDFAIRLAQKLNTEIISFDNLYQAYLTFKGKKVGNSLYLREKIRETGLLNPDIATK